MADEEIIRQNKNNVAVEEKERCIGALKKCKEFTFKSFLPTTDNCHFERYNFVSGKDKLGIVYDTKAQILSCTAKQSVLARVPFLAEPPKNAPASKEENKQGNKPQQAQAKQKQQQKKQKQQNKPPQQQQQVKQKTPPPDMPLEKPADKATKEPKVRSLSVVSPQEKLPAAKQEQQKLPQVKNERRNLPQVKKEQQRLPQAVSATKEKHNEKPPKERRNKKGKQPKENVQTPQLDKKVERGLKKLMPDAFALLDMQCKKDFGIGMVDIGNDKVRLSDYSVLLVPPYRALEHFIYILQQARGISVKLIGQAYEKDAEGKHVLKQCYRKKSGVVYSEVMSALYAEYFVNRHLCTHSDNTDTSSSRMIVDKSAVKVIFDKLCEIVNYNGKKLTEIGFTPVIEQ